MRKSVENRAENYIKKHRNYRKWLAFALCIALLTGTVTLYTLNRPAVAMTEDAFGSIGIIDTYSEEEEQALIDTMYNDENDDSDDGDEQFTDDGENASEELNGDSSDENGEKENDGVDEGKDENGDDDGTDDDKEGEPTTPVEGNEDAAGEATLGEGATEEASDEDSSKAASDASSEATTAAADDASSLESSETSLEASSEVSLDEEDLEELKDVVITVYYVDPKGEEISDPTELSINNTFEIKDDAKKFEGYVYTKALLGELIRSR